MKGEKRAPGKKRVGQYFALSVICNGRARGRCHRKTIVHELSYAQHFPRGWDARDIFPWIGGTTLKSQQCTVEQKEEAGLLKGLRSGRSGPSISHLLFADDTIFSPSAIKGTLML